MIKIQAVTFECSTVEEAAALARQFGFIPTSPFPVMDLTNEREVAPSIPHVHESKKDKKKHKKDHVNLDASLADAALMQAGIEPKKRRTRSGSYKPIYTLEPGASATLQEAEKKGLHSAIWRAKKMIPGSAFTYKESTAGKFRVTRTA
jgi:hypothetical protein